MNRARFLPRQHELTSPDLSETRPDPATAKREAPWVKRQHESEESAAQGMALLQQLVAHTGGLLTLSKAPPINDVLYTGARMIGAQGFDLLEFPVQVATVSIANVSPSLLSVGYAGTGSTPAQGAGLQRIPPGTFRTFAKRGEGIRVFGQPGSSSDPGRRRPVRAGSLRAPS
jgi:hypothetical protein